MHGKGIIHSLIVLIIDYIMLVLCLFLYAAVMTVMHSLWKW